MVDAKQAIIFSAVFVVLVSIPAASEQVKIQENSKNGFEAVIDTEFSDKFSFSMESGLEKMELVNSESRFNMRERPSERFKSIDTPRGSLEVTRTNSSVVRKVKSPYGTLKTGIRDGKRFASFEGLNRSRVEELKEDLVSRMNTKKREADAKRRAVMDRILADVDLVVTEGGDSEHVNVTNVDNRTLSIDGWTITNLEGDVYTLEGVLAPEETRTLYPKEYGDPVDNSVVETDVTLYSTGGEIELKNSEGYLLASEKY